MALESVEIECGGDFLRLVERFLDEPFLAFLDSAAQGARFGRFSVLAVGPAWVLSVWGAPPSAAMGLGQLELRRFGAQRFGALDPGDVAVERYVAAPFDELARLLDTWALPDALRAECDALPFVGGAIGFAGYDAGRFLERLPEVAELDLELPEFCWLFADVVFVHDHSSGVTRLVATGRAGDAAAAERACRQLLDEFCARLAREPGPAHAGAARVGPLRAYADAAGYARLVRDAQEHVLAGDVFEVNTAHRLEAAYSGAPWQLYTALRAQSPAAFAAYVATPWGTLLSSSPERFLCLDRERWAESRPIKGTRPRGSSTAEDARLHAELAASEKDRAENVMIVDLVRNDFGRVCDVDSIHVPELMIVETHPSVFHMVSTVRGRLARDASPVQLFTACFPPGSMTGAPKIEAMKLIDALEPYRRAAYAGAIGYFDVRGGMDFSVVIRTFVLSAGRCCFSVGGAIVADSDPHAEYLETMDKARAMLAALSRVRAGEA